MPEASDARRWPKCTKLLIFPIQKTRKIDSSGTSLSNTSSLSLTPMSESRFTFTRAHVLVLGLLTRVCIRRSLVCCVYVCTVRCRALSVPLVDFCSLFPIFDFLPSLSLRAALTLCRASVYTFGMSVFEHFGGARLTFVIIFSYLKIEEVNVQK